MAVTELDAYRTAKLMLDQHGAQEAWRMLMERAVVENEAGRAEHLQITRQVLGALEGLTGSLGTDGCNSGGVLRNG